MLVGLNNIGVIPARLHSTRFHKKMLTDINGKPMVIRTAEQVSKSKNLDRIIVAIDSNETYQALKGFNLATNPIRKLMIERYSSIL